MVYRWDGMVRPNRGCGLRHCIAAGLIGLSGCDWHELQPPEEITFKPELTQAYDVIEQHRHDQSRQTAARAWSQLPIAGHAIRRVTAHGAVPVAPGSIASGCL